MTISASSAAQTHPAIYGTAISTVSGIANSASGAFSAASTDPLFGNATTGASLNSSLLNALLGIGRQSQAASPNSATTEPDNNSGSRSGSGAAHHQHGISAYIAQLANSAASAPG